MTDKVMSPRRAANDLTKVWRASRPVDEWYPVDCILIARALGILVHGEAFPKNFEGVFRVSDDTKAIIYNERIQEPGRKNFTLAHELGHAALHRNHPELMCTAENLRDFPRQRDAADPEQQANQFAAALLMPPDDVREHILNRPPTVDLASTLARRYRTTLTATAIRIAELSGKQATAVVIVGDDLRVNWCWPNGPMRRAGLWLPKGSTLPAEILAHVDSNCPIDSRYWLPEDRAGGWLLHQSVLSMPNYRQSLFFLRAESLEGARDYLDGI